MNGLLNKCQKGRRWTLNAGLIKALSGVIFYKKVVKKYYH